MNRSGAPANCWLLCLIYVCYLLNHISCAALDGKIPLFALTGINQIFLSYSSSLLISLCSMQHMINISFLKVKRGLLTRWALGRIVVMPRPTSSWTMKPRKLSTAVLLGLRNLLLPTIDLHHMDGRFLHLLTLLKIIFLWITTGTCRKFFTKTEDPYSLHQVQK